MRGDKAGSATATAGTKPNGAQQALGATDLRTGQAYELPVTDSTVKAIDLRQVKVDDEDFGLLSYDPGYTNTVPCRSAITFIDGDRGILEYRGYPIEQLAVQSSFLEVVYLLLNGELPSAAELQQWTQQVDAASDREQAVRLIAQMPTLAAAAYRAFQGQPLQPPDPGLSYVGRFLAQLFGDRPGWQPDPTLERALDVLFILHADHEQNCSTSAVRGVASSDADPYAAVSAGIGALSGPLHGGANEAVLRMLREIGTKDRVPSFIEDVKAGKRRLMGFGHRVYKSYDPRAKVIKETTDRVFEVTGVNPLLEIAQELERIALSDDYFIERKLYPNVDFYSGLIYEALQFPPEMFTVLFAIPRTSGWLAQWLEMLNDPDQKIARPRQVYTGERGVQYVPM